MPIRPPQFQQPPAGIPIDQDFTIRLDTSPLEDGLSLVLGPAIIIFSCPLLVQLVRDKPTQWKTEPERRALIRGSRAEAILAHTSNTIDAWGCRPVSISTSNDGIYLIDELLQAGQVNVINSITQKRLSQIVVNFNATVAGPLAGMGHMCYTFTPGASPFLWLNWWVS